MTVDRVAESKLEERGAGGGAGAGGAVAVAELCHLDPQRLTQYNFNLRLVRAGTEPGAGRGRARG